MGVLQNKIDFTVVVTAKNANPNGDPLNGNRPRETYDGFGEISDVCIKRKIRNRLQDMGEKIFVQSDDRCDDGCDSLRARIDGNEAMKKIDKIFTKFFWPEINRKRPLRTLFSFLLFQYLSLVSKQLSYPDSFRFWKHFLQMIKHPVERFFWGSLIYIINK